MPPHQNTVHPFTLLAKANKEAHEKVQAKSNWTISKQNEIGKFLNYRNENITLKARSKPFWAI
jgi:plasmid rolling circle replication initiator protein Rep